MDLYPLVKSIFKGGLKILDYVVDSNKYIISVAYKCLFFKKKNNKKIEENRYDNEKLEKIKNKKLVKKK